MNLLNQSAFLKALGWSLLSSLWQMALLWLVYVVLTWNGKKLLSRQRHTIALLSLAGGSLWFLITLVINFYKAAQGPEVVTVFVSGNDLNNYSTNSWPGVITHWFEPALPFLSLAYLLAAAFLFVRFYFQYRHTQRLFTTGLQKADPEWRAFLQQVAGRMGIKKKVQIWLSALVDTPVTLGFWKPVILLPIAAVNNLTLKQAEAIILHELNHIRRNDYLVNLLIACVDVILFFNPFARLLTGIIRKERENCCDDLVLQFCYEPHSYARALLTLEQNRMSSNELVLAATGKDKHFLLNRVKRILGKEPVSNPVNQKMIAYLLCSLLIGFIGWYNPGDIIVKKIDDIRLNTAMAPETVHDFVTPASYTISVSAAPVAPKKAPVVETGKVKHTQCCPDHKDPFKKLEQIIELTTDAKLAALTKQADASPEQMAGFINNLEAIDYSLSQNNTVIAPPPAANIYPYVPNNSFFFQPLEDTALPKKYVMTYNDLKAKEAMEKALKGLQQVNWKQLEMALKAQGKKIDMNQLQHEIEKAMQQVNWKKINEDSQQAIEEANDEIQTAQDMYVVQLGNYQRERAIRQEKLKQAQQQILLDRLQQHEELKKLEEEKKKGCTIKKKKIVQI